MRFLERVIGNYELIRFINEGGWAYVYEAKHQTLPKRVAVKILKESISHDKSQSERFVREAMILSSLDHPNIVKVLDISTIDGIPAIIMEYLEGRDLKDILRESGGLPADYAKSLFLQMLDAIEYAHGKGVFHRDINPSNVFILKDGIVKVLDFGIAKVTDEGSEGTRTGTAMGTPAFMSPEQVKAEKNIDGKSDIYSLGVTLFTMLNGKHPYAGMESQFDIQSKVVLEPLPQLSNCESINRVIRKATEKNRDQRFASISDFRQAFYHAFDEKTVIFQTPSITPKTREDITRKSRKPLWAMVVILATIVVFASFWTFNSDDYGPTNNIERQVRTDVQRRGILYVGVISLDTIDDQMTNRFSRVFGANKDILLVKCEDFNDLITKVNESAVDIAMLKDEEIPKSQNSFDLTMSDIQCESKDGLYLDCRLVLPKGNERLLDQLDFKTTYTK